MLLSFTLNELLYIDDHLIPMIVAPQIADRTMIPTPPAGEIKNLILKIGAAIVELDDGYPQGSDGVTIDLTEDELWVLREIALSSVVIGNEHVGKNLKVRIYRALRSIAANPVTGSFLMAPENENNRESTLEKLRALENQSKENEWKEDKSVEEILNF